MDVLESSRRSEQGFTMLELLVVVVIAAMALALVAPAIDSGLRARELRSTVRAVAGAMRTLQADAIRSGQVQTLLVDPQANALRIPGRETELTLGEVAQVAQIRGGELEPGGTVRVSFYPNGSTSGLALLLDDRDAPGDRGFIVQLDPLIGLVTVHDEEP